MCGEDVREGCEGRVCRKDGGEGVSEGCQEIAFGEGVRELFGESMMG